MSFYFFFFFGTCWTLQIYWLRKWTKCKIFESFSWNELAMVSIFVEKKNEKKNFTQINRCFVSICRMWWWSLNKRKQTAHDKYHYYFLFFLYENKFLKKWSSTLKLNSLWCNGPKLLLSKQHNKKATSEKEGERERDMKIAKIIIIFIIIMAIYHYTDFD